MRLSEGMKHTGTSPEVVVCRVHADAAETTRIELAVGRLVTRIVGAALERDRAAADAEADDDRRSPAADRTGR